MKFGQIKRPLLFICLGVSALIHIGAIWVLYLNPFYFESETASAAMKPSSAPQIVPKDDSDLLVEKMERALEESLNTAIAMTAPSQDQSDIALEDDSDDALDNDEVVYVPPAKTLFASSPSIRDNEAAIFSSQEVSFTASMPPLFDPLYEEEFSEFALDNELDDSIFSYESETMASVDISEQRYQTTPPSTAEIIHDDYTMTDEQFTPSSLPIHSGEDLSPDFIASLQRLKAPKEALPAEEMCEDKMFTTLEESTAPKLILPNSVDYLRDKWIKRSLAERKLPDLESYGFGDIAMTVEWEEDLDVDVALMPTQTPNQYVFSVTVHPEFTTNTPSMKQNFYFAIDRSSSIEKHKFSRFKRAVQRSLAALHDGDNFNIYVFDRKVSKLSDRALPVTPKTIHMAEEFLESQSSKTHFAATEVYNSLEEMLPSRFDPDELHSVILITDGNTLLNSNQQKQAIARWSEKYDGLVNFYAAAAGKGNNLVLLDVLSYTTAGKLLYSDTNAGFPRKLVRLVKDLHNPIIKDLSVEVQAKDPRAHITLYPKKSQLPPMFAEKSYTIVGTIDELCDLTLHIQGRNHDKWLNIRKDIPLTSGPSHSRALEKLWATTQSRICYDHFLKNGKTSHLKEAVQIVAPYRGVIASDQ